MAPFAEHRNRPGVGKQAGGGGGSFVCPPPARRKLVSCCSCLELWARRGGFSVAGAEAFLLGLLLRLCGPRRGRRLLPRKALSGRATQTPRLGRRLKGRRSRRRSLCRRRGQRWSGPGPGQAFRKEGCRSGVILRPALPNPRAGSWVDQGLLQILSPQAPVRVTCRPPHPTPPIPVASQARGSVCVWGGGEFFGESPVCPRLPREEDSGPVFFRNLGSSSLQVPFWLLCDVGSSAFPGV